MIEFANRASRYVIVTCMMLMISGCASNPSNGPVYDPLENVNRKIYRFNDALDRAVLKPVAEGYRFVTPDFLETGISNFFSNLDDITVIVNDLLQGKFRQAGADTGRFLYNTTAGLFGFFDFSTGAGMIKNNESFGQTLGVWGIGEGPFLMVPFFGPNNVRSTTGLAVDSQVLDIRDYAVDDTDLRTGLTAIDIISLRASLLSAGNLLDSAALDPYLMLRDFWVQNHRRNTCDGRCDTRLGTADSDDTDWLDELDDLDRLDAMDELDRLDAMDEMDELDRLDAMDELDRLDAMDELDRLDAMDELDRLDAMDPSN